VDVFRNGAKITTTANSSGAYTDDLGRGASGTYTYQVCAAGTSICSNEATVTFSFEWDPSFRQASPSAHQAAVRAGLVGRLRPGRGAGDRHYAHTGDDGPPHNRHA
jgi:hypothetical protein